MVQVVFLGQGAENFLANLYKLPVLHLKEDNVRNRPCFPLQFWGLLEVFVVHGDGNTIPYWSQAAVSSTLQGLEVAPSCHI